MKRVRQFDQSVPTIEFHPPASKPAPPKHWKRSWITLLISLVMGIALGHFCWPRHTTVLVGKVTYITVPELTPELPVPAPTEPAVEAWQGFLVIKDGESQTVLNKRAAIKTKKGLVPLTTNTAYWIHYYANYQSTGFGICSDGQQNFFLAIWQNGATSPPSTNPGTFYVSSGKKIALGPP